MTAHSDITISTAASSGEYAPGTMPRQAAEMMAETLKEQQGTMMVGHKVLRWAGELIGSLLHCLDMANADLARLNGSPAPWRLTYNLGGKLANLVRANREAVAAMDHWLEQRGDNADTQAMALWRAGRGADWAMSMRGLARDPELTEWAAAATRQMLEAKGTVTLNLDAGALGVPIPADGFAPSFEHVRAWRERATPDQVLAVLNDVADALAKRGTAHNARELRQWLDERREQERARRDTAPDRANGPSRLHGPAGWYRGVLERIPAPPIVNTLEQVLNLMGVTVNEPAERGERTAGWEEAHGFLMGCLEEAIAHHKTRPPYRSGERAGRMAHDLPAGESDRGEAVTERPAPRDCKTEPPYPDTPGMCVFALRFPHLTAHLPTKRCAVQEPHGITQCAEWADD